MRWLYRRDKGFSVGEEILTKTLLSFSCWGGERLTNDYGLTESERELLQRHRSSARSLNWLQDLHVV